MLVDNSIYKNVYKGNGVTTEFPISFPFLENSHVQVVRSIETDTAFITEEVVPTTEYGITGAGIEKGGTCIFTVAPPTGTTIAIVRNVPITQLYAYEELDSFPAESHEDALAKLTMICQMLAEQIARALIIGATDGRTPEDVLEDFFNKYNEVLELYEKILIVTGDLFTCSIVPFTTVDGQTQYSVGTELPLDPDANNLLLSLGGVLQEPDVAYKILDSSHIEFTSNPGDGLRCWGRTSVSFSNPDIRSIIENAIMRIEEAAQAQIDRIGDELKEFSDGETIIIDENGKFSVPVFTPPTESESGKKGLVPAPAPSEKGYYLRSDGIWAHPIPTGTIIWSASAEGLEECLPALGAEVNRATYANLFKKIGTTYGAGDGSTTFNLPNLIGRVAWGGTTPGQSLEAGLPDVTGYVGRTLSSNNTNNGAVKFINRVSGQWTQTATFPEAVTADAFYTLSNANPIYGNSTTVQPPALTLVPYIKY